MEEKDQIKLNTLHAILHEAKTIQKYMDRIEGIIKDLQGDLSALQDEYRIGFLESVCIEAEIG